MTKHHPGELSPAEGVSKVNGPVYGNMGAQSKAKTQSLVIGHSSDSPISPKWKEADQEYFADLVSGTFLRRYKGSTAVLIWFIQ